MSRPTAQLHLPWPGRVPGVGTVLEGLRVAHVVAVRPGLYTLAEATAKNGKRVTVKVLEQRVTENGHRRRLARLVAMRTAVKHPNMLPLLRANATGELVVMGALPEGAGTLEERLRGGPIERDEAIRILSQVAGALDTARGRGLAHRELSPASILLTGDDRSEVILTDFGITLPEAAGCERRAGVDDADYRSPEEIRGEGPTEASNVYSLACVLVECLTGSPPYPYDRPLLALHAHLTEGPPNVSARNAALPRALDEVVAKGMAKDPAGRYRHAGLFMHAVQQAVGAQMPIPVPALAKRAPAAPPAKAAPPTRRERASRPAPTPAPPARRPAPKPQPWPRPSRRLERKQARRDGRLERKQARRDGRRERRAARGRLQRRVRVASRVTPAWAGIALVACATAGFAAGNTGTDAPSAPAPPVNATTPATSAPAKPVVTPVVQQLDERRAAARRRLRAARRPGAQAAAATELADAYRNARESLESAPGRFTFESDLTEQLAQVELAYRELAMAARKTRPGAWKGARDEALDRERDLALLLSAHRWV
jgi:serine/threonine protein kinase